MLYVPLYVEGLRTRPTLVFVLATLAQALLWLLVPVLFYSAPPGDLPQVLAIGRQFPLHGAFGPPLAYWLAEIAFRVAGLFGVYALAQICVVTIYWCVFALGRTIVGATHAAMAVLLMTGISAFTVPSPDFGPPLLTAALWALVLLHYWRAAVQKHRASWFVFGAAAVLMLATSEVAVILLGLVVALTALSTPGRTALRAIEAKIVGLALVCFLVLDVFWLHRAGVMPTLERFSAAGMVWVWLRLLGALVLAQAGLAILLVLASGWPRTFDQAPVLARSPIDPFAVTYVTTFALAPALLATIVAVLIGTRLPIESFAPLVVLSGLAAIVAAGNSIVLHHQRILGFAWAGLLVVPVIFVPLVIAFLPWATGTDLKVAQPAAAMGRFFAESFERRTGHPLAIVGGDDRLAALVALAAPSRPRVYFAADPALSPWVTARDIQAQGAIVVWPEAETTPVPPPGIKALFPDLVPEVPKIFERPLRSWAPRLRIGWGMIRPADGSTSAPR